MRRQIVLAVIFLAAFIVLRRGNTQRRDGLDRQDNDRARVRYAQRATGLRRHLKDHPLPTYLAAGVSVVLSSDDAGISRIDLTNEYLRAARDYGLEYRALKAIARNALIYSFLDEAQKRDELARFDRASAEFERSMASRQSPLQNAVALIKAAVTLPP